MTFRRLIVGDKTITVFLSAHVRVCSLDCWVISREDQLARDTRRARPGEDFHDAPAIPLP